MIYICVYSIVRTRTVNSISSISTVIMNKTFHISFVHFDTLSAVVAFT